MSTTFGVLIKEGYKVVEMDESIVIDVEDDIEDIFEPVAFRSDYIYWKNPIAHLLPDDLKVYALDNSSQGIYTIGDIKKEILKIN